MKIMQKKQIVRRGKMHQPLKEKLTGVEILSRVLSIVWAAVVAFVLYMAWNKANTYGREWFFTQYPMATNDDFTMAVGMVVLAVLCLLGMLGCIIEMIGWIFETRHPYPYLTDAYFDRQEACFRAVFGPKRK